MTPTPVGMRCPECSRERTKVKTASTLRAPSLGRYNVTQILIAINVLVFFAETASGTPLGGVGSVASGRCTSTARSTGRTSTGSTSTTGC